MLSIISIMSSIRSTLASILLACGTSALCAEQRADASVDSIMATMTVSPGIWNGAVRVLGAADHFSRNPSSQTATQLAADLRLLTASCSNYRNLVRDSNWKTIRPDFQSLLGIVKTSILTTVQTNEAAALHAPLPLRYLELCEKACSTSISR